MHVSFSFCLPVYFSTYHSRLACVLKRPLHSTGKPLAIKKCSKEMQTLCAGCSKAEPKIFAPPQTPFLGAEDAQNLIS